MTLRYVVSFPTPVTASQLACVADGLVHAAASRAHRDLILTNGGTITDMRPKRPSAAFVSRARSRAR